MSNKNKNNIKIKRIKPINNKQQKAEDIWRYTQKHLVMHGSAGTGKTFLALNFALSDTSRKIVIIRNVVQTRNMGFLPGSEQEKKEVFEAPYKGILSELAGRGDAYDILKKKGKIEFMTTSFIRGITIDNASIIIDEFQNMSDQELHSIMTRIGQNSRFIMCGDVNQDDLTSERFGEESGAMEMMEILSRLDTVAFVNFEVGDIVRSGFVKEYLVARENYEYPNFLINGGINKLQ